MTGCNVNIPYYGRGQYLRRTLRSVLSQTVRREELEITIFDDCCPEEAKKYIPKKEDARSRVIRNVSNVGMVGNWNRCLEHGDRECIHVLHGDDILDPEFYVEILKVFDKHEGVGLVHTGYRPLFSRRTSTRYWGRVLRHHPVGKNEIKVFKGGDEAVRHILKGVICSSVVLRRNAVLDCGLFRTDLLYSSDEEYWARVAARWAVGYVSLPLTVYRYHVGNYHLKSWLNHDFWDKWQETRLARIAHLVSGSEEDIVAQSNEMARVAVGISHQLLAAGYRDCALKYLDYASKIYPQIGDDHWFGRVSGWISQGRRGRMKAWLRSSH